MAKIFHTQSPLKTRQLARQIAKEFLKLNIRIFFLEGSLGSGKTVFVQGIARELGIRRPVKSPSFVIIQNYPGLKFNLVHVDCYRMGKAKDFNELGLDDFLDDTKNILAIEWSSKLPLSWRQGLRAGVISIKCEARSNDRLIETRIF